MVFIAGTAGNDQLFGTALRDLIFGYEGDDIINGREGTDQMTGGLGDDKYVVDNPEDRVVEFVGQGNDLITSAIDFSLEDASNVEDLFLLEGNSRLARGNELNNVLIGNNNDNRIDGLAGDDQLRGEGGNDYLDGGEGRDRMEGGTENDLFIVDNAGDVVVENVNEGEDRVIASVSYTLSANVEFLGLNFETTTPIDGTGNELNNEIFGNDAQNTLRGLAGADQLRGGGGDDTLDGGIGADQLAGELGNDIYIINEAGDVITEAANAGTDTVQASISFSLGDNVENLTLIGTNTINATGNDANNLMIGNASANRLNGGAGVDQLAGGLGNDVYIIHEALDGVTEAANAGTDTVQASINYFLGDNVENLILSGTGNIKGIGNDANNLIVGNAGVNLIDSGAGSDILFSGGGADRMTGGDGADRFVLSAPGSGVDRILDFDMQEGDVLVVDSDDFAGLQQGTLRRSQFVQGTAALDRNDRFIYNQRNGALFYDRDGSGGAAQVQIATLGGKPALAASDIIVAASPF